MIDQKKTLGQHWLNDKASLDAVYQAIEITSDDTILEVGPGLGALTERLVQNAKQVVAVELDQRLIVHLKSTIGSANLKIVNQNILEFDLTSLPEGYKVVANIPYYLTAKLLRQLCESPNPFSDAAILVQKEVAQRVSAKPGSMSLLSVSVQFYCETRLGESVTADKFTPPPKVDSQILILGKRPVPLFADVDNAKFFRIVKAAFSQRRKTLLNSLSGGLQLDRAETSKLISNAGLNPLDRAQTLSLDNWHKLYLQFK